jgi:hypothetical protein
VVASSLILSILLSGGTVAAPVAEAAMGAAGAADKADAREGENVLNRFLGASSRNVLRGVSMFVHFAGQLPKLNKSGEIHAKRTVSMDGHVEYVVEGMERSGDKTVQKDLIGRFMSAESETKEQDPVKIAITPENYKFKYKGLQEKGGREVHVYEVNPRKKRVGLFKGELWVDPETGLTVREAGRFVKSPSVFLKRVDFTRDYEILDGFSVPKAMQTTIQTRFWGAAVLAIRYSDFQWSDKPAAESESALSSCALEQPPVHSHN